MKTIVVPNLNQDLISIHDLPDNPIIGTIDNFGIKGWLQRMNYNSDEYCLFCARSGVSLANKYRGNTVMDLQSMLKWMVSEPNSFKLFLFEDERELFAWLSKP